MDPVRTQSAPFRHYLRVRYHETDQQGIVYHARYLEYLDVAMTEYFRFLGWDYLALVAEGCDPSLVTTTLEFHQPARVEEEISISVHPIRVGLSSFTLSFEICRCTDSQRLLSASTAYVNLDPKIGKSRPLPQRVREKLLEVCLPVAVSDPALPDPR
jgi:acyl-CoA thioester hydrolase